MNGYVWVGILLLGLVVLGFSGLVFQRLAQRADRKRFTLVGRMVDVGGYRLHITEEGKARPGVPAVLLDTGLAGDSTSWGLIMPQVAQMTRVYAYDRAGVGYSDPRPAGVQLTSQFLAHELEALLRGAGIMEPLVLVGHSFGGHSLRILATHYPQRVAGMVLVDCSHEDMWQRFGDHKGLLNSSTKMSMRVMSWLARFGILRLIFRGLTSRLSGWDPDRRQELYRSLSDDRHWKGVAAEAMHSGQVEAAVRTSRQHLGEIPCIVIAALADKGKPGSLRRQAWHEMQVEHASFSTNTSLWLPPDVTHLGLGFNPAEARYTVEAIRSVLQQVATGKPSCVPMPVLG